VSFIFLITKVFTPLIFEAVTWKEHFSLMAWQWSWHWIFCDKSSFYFVECANSKSISEMLNIGKAHFHTQELMWLHHLVIIPFLLCCFLSSTLPSLWWHHWQWFKAIIFFLFQETWAIIVISLWYEFWTLINLHSWMASCCGT
jgi:hypothetical protein